MFPNLRAEMARRNINIKELHSALNSHGIKIALSTLSQKLSGKYEFTLDEAEAIRNELDTSLSLDVLFEREEA